VFKYVVEWFIDELFVDPSRDVGDKGLRKLFEFEAEVFENIEDIFKEVAFEFLINIIYHKATFSNFIRRLLFFKHDLIFI